MNSALKLRASKLSQAKRVSTLFQDKTYDSLDFLSKAIEPFEHPFDDILNSLPKEIRLVDKDFRDLIVGQGPYVGSSVYRRDVFKRAVKNELVAEYADYIQSFYDTVLLPDSWIDIEHATSNGGILLTRNSKVITEEEVKQIALEKMQDDLGSITYCNFKNLETKSRLYEIIESLDVDTTGSKNAVRKYYALKRHILTHIFDKWKLRSLDGVLKLGGWISDYIVKGNYSSYVNITHFKVMTHAGHAIYDLQEVAK